MIINYSSVHPCFIHHWPVSLCLLTTSSLRWAVQAGGGSALSPGDQLFAWKARRQTLIRGYTHRQNIQRRRPDSSLPISLSWELLSCVFVLCLCQVSLEKTFYCLKEMKLNTTEYFCIKYYIWMQYTWWCVALESSFTSGLIWNMLGYNLGPAPIRKCWKEREALALVKKSSTVKQWRIRV